MEVFGRNSRLPIYSDSQSPVAARPGTLSIKADNRRLLAAADIIETADLGFRPISNGGSLAGHRFNTEEKMIRIPKEWRPKPCSCGSGKLWSRNTMPAASFSPTPARIVTTARWPSTGLTCSPIRPTGPMSRLTMIRPWGRAAWSVDPGRAGPGRR